MAGNIGDIAVMMNEFLSESEALKNIKFKKAEINGHEVYEVTYPNGNRAVVTSPEQAIATCQMAMQMEFLAKSLSEVETPKGKLNDVKEASATNPAENAEAKILSEVAPDFIAFAKKYDLPILLVGNK